MALDAENEDKLLIHVKTETDEFNLHGRPCELSAFSHVPPTRNAPTERTVFNSPKQMETGRHFAFDVAYPPVENYFNDKLHREDRAHAKSRGLDVHTEEFSKDVPTLSSSLYGFYLDHKLEKQDRSHVRIGLVKSEFYRRNGVDKKPYVPPRS